MAANQAPPESVGEPADATAQSDAKHDAPDAPTPGRGAMIALMLVVVAYAGLSHYSASTPDAKALAASLSVGPVVLIALVLAWRWTRRVTAAVVTLATAALLVRYWTAIENHFEWSDLVQQIGAYGLIAMSFARSLLPGHVPVCTQLGAKLHGELAPVEVRYLRRATLFYALFYAALAIAIGALFFLLSTSGWSLFTNFITFGLIVLVSLVDHAIRHRVLPKRERGGILTVIQRAIIG